MMSYEATVRKGPRLTSKDYHGLRRMYAAGADIPQEIAQEVGSMSDVYGKGPCRVGSGWRWRLATAIVAALSGAVCFLAEARGAAPAPQAKANFEQEWARLIAGAQKEGTLAIAPGGAPSREYRPVADVFQKKFGIKVEIATGSGNDTVTRVLAERKAGRYTVDVGLVSLRANNQRLVPSESLVPLAPLFIHPEVVDTSGWYLGRHWYGDKESKYVLIYHVEQENQYEVWYNTD